MISIFTPTYNRGYILPQLYDSLKRQSSTDFEWIIVDDGSTDETEKLVIKWQSEKNAFKITFMKQKNAGKHIAINKGVSLAKGEWFFIVDSDDYIVDNAVEKINQWVLDCNCDKFAGVAGTRITNSNSTIGGEVAFETPFVDCKNNERERYGLGGDKAEVYKTSILRKYPFPQFVGEKFLSECAVWDHIAIDGLKIRWFNSPLMICNYLPDGLTAKVNRLELDNFQGYTYTTNIRLKAYSGVEHYRIIGQYVNKAIHKNISIKKIAKNIKQPLFLILLMNIVVALKNKISGDRTFG